MCYLIEDIQKNTQVKLGEAVRLALQQVIGAYAIVVISKSEPDKLIAARKSSPLVVGIGHDGDFFLASDATPIVEYTKKSGLHERRRNRCSSCWSRNEIVRH